MRNVLIILGILVVVLIGAIALAVSNVNAYLEENRETLGGLASDAAGREVSFERAEVAFSGGLAVRVGGLRVAEDPRFGQPDFLALEEAYVGIRLLPALQQRIEVSGIRLDAPTIRVIQTAEGFNFSTLGGSGETPPPPPEGDTEEAAPLAVAIAVLEIEGGTIVYEDRSTPDGLSLVIEDFETSGTDLSLDGPIAVDFAGLVHSAKPADEGLESWLEGDVRLASLDPLAGTVQLRSPSLHPAIFGVRLDEGGEVEHIDDLVVDARLTPDPAKSGYPVQVRSGEARLSGFDLEDIAIDVVYRDAPGGAEVHMEPVSVGLAGGTIALTGDVVLGEPGASPFDLETTLRELDAGELAHVLMDVPAGALSGTLAGDVKLAGDSLEWESLKQSLVGSLELEIGEGALEQVNVLDTLVGRLTSDPGLGALTASSIRDVAPDALEGDRTPFEGIDMALEILDGAVHAKNLKIAAGDFAIDAAGRVGLDGAVAADGRILFSEDLSQKILAKADRLAPLLGEGDQVELPLRFGGTTAAPSITPDLTALTAKAKDELKDRAAKELTDRLFGKPKEGEASEADRDSAEGMIKEGLGRFLGR